MKNKKQNSRITQTIGLKQLAFMILFVSIVFICTDGNAQIFRNAIFYTVQVQQRNMIAFTVDREVNVRYYNIEAANDSERFTIIDKINSLGNTMIPRDYHCDITVAGSGYKYYRVTCMYMNWQNEHSPVIRVAQAPVNSPNYENIPATSQIVSAKHIQ